MRKIRYCHLCKIPVTGSSHWKLHKNIPENIRKLDFYLYNFPYLKDKDNLIDLYVNKKYSLPMICKLANGIDLKALCFIFNQYGIKIRSIKEALNEPETQKRYKESCLIKFGATNCLSKGTEPYKKRNKTVQDKYGVENVFQLLDEFMQEHGTKYSRSKISKLNIYIENLLKKNNILYVPEFRIKYINDNGHQSYKFYDFNIVGTNILIEVNGNYWHANPDIYTAKQEFQFPKIKLSAEDIWKMDEFKKYIAEVNNYTVVYIWEKEIKDLSEDELVKKIKDCINRKT